MSRSHYTVDKNLSYTIRGTAKLLNVASAKYGGDWHSVPHTHNHVELFYIIGGKGQFLINDELYPVNTNHLVIINPNVLHTEVSLNAQPLEYIVLGVDGIELSINNSSNGQFCILDHYESLDIASCLRNILREMEFKQPGYEDICQAYMEILIIRLMRSTGLSVPAASVSLAGNRQCVAIRRYIDVHFKEPLTLDSLAEEAHINKYYLSHAFKREYGISPINYMNYRRIEESKYLLAETDLSLSQISQLLGFSSLSYFSQVFRKTQEISPLEYRQNLRHI
ncbi:MAG: AraC family transcriptional regulator [Oscillospiraceae bacterium]